MIIAVSDVHVGSAECNTDDFIRFLNNVILRKFEDDEITDLVLCGDIFDFWRCNMMDMMVEGNHVMERLLYVANNGIKVHYIAGNHDYVMRKVQSVNIEFSTGVKLIDKGVFWEFLHGWEMDPVQNQRYFDAFCYSNTVNSEFTQHTFKNYAKYLPLARKVLTWIDKRKIKKEMSDMFWHKEDPEAWGKVIDRPSWKTKFTNGGTVIGHTHLPTIDNYDCLVNCGSWVRSSPMTNTYVEISGSSVHLKRYI